MITLTRRQKGVCSRSFYEALKLGDYSMIGQYDALMSINDQQLELIDTDAKTFGKREQAATNSDAQAYLDAFKEMGVSRVRVRK